MRSTHYCTYLLLSQLRLNGGSKRVMRACTVRLYSIAGKQSVVLREKSALLVISRSNNGRDVSGMTSAVKGSDGRFVAYSSASVVVGGGPVGVKE
jgi:hypothetical protein